MLINKTISLSLDRSYRSKLQQLSIVVEQQVIALFKVDRFLLFNSYFESLTFDKSTINSKIILRYHSHQHSISESST